MNSKSNLAIGITFIAIIGLFHFLFDVTFPKSYGKIYMNNDALNDVIVGEKCSEIESLSPSIKIPKKIKYEIGTKKYCYATKTKRMIVISTPITKLLNGEDSKNRSIATIKYDSCRNQGCYYLMVDDELYSDNGD